LKHPKVLAAVRSTSLDIDAEELLMPIHVAGHRVDHLSFLEEAWPAEHSQRLLGNFVIHAALAEARRQVDAHHLSVL